jgi:hypothetical protein
MTETEWLDCRQPDKMLKYLKTRASDRKLRLWMVACCRTVWHLFSDERSRTAVEVAERFADGLADEEELYTLDGLAWEAVEELHGGPRETEHASRAAAWATHREERWAYRRDAAQATALEAERAATGQGVAWEVAVTEQSGFLRDIIGTSLQGTPSIERAWLTWNDGTVVKLAQSIYDGRRFDDLPILADALEEAGCNDEEILAHCRGPGPHVRGCWVVDLLLGKS